jgi:uncharacterized protein YkwD
MKKRFDVGGLSILLIVAIIVGIMISRGVITLPNIPQILPPNFPFSTSTPDTSGTGNGGGNTDAENQLAQQLFNQINSDRATQGLPAYTWSNTLAKGAYQHNVTMTTTGCGLAHQCP